MSAASKKKQAIKTKPPARSATTRSVAKALAPKKTIGARPRESGAVLFKGVALEQHAREVYRRLLAAYPDAHCELEFTAPLQLVVATILSAQCTDKRVNMVTPALFSRYPDARALAGAELTDLEALVKSTGFYRNKARSILGMARALVERHGGEVPRTMAELVALPGVGRKTANVVLGNAFGIDEGIVVDTHVARLAARLGLTRETGAVKIEQALIPLFPRNSWTMLSHLVIWHGRRVCDARKPRCADCTLRAICPSAVA